MLAVRGAADRLDPNTYKILLDFYVSTGGANWIDNSGWNDTSSDYCQWFGVYCAVANAGSSVVEIKLNNNQLTGTIPASLGSLTNLTYIILNGNQLVGTIPPEIGSLEFLQALYLPDNQLGGTIPSWLGSIWSLHELDLGNNQFTGTIPPSLGSLGNLLWLELRNNTLTGTIPSSFGSLAILEFLSLDDNQLRSIGLKQLPPDLDHCSFAQNPFACPIPSWATSGCNATCT